MSAWISFAPQAGPPRARVCCLPYAGGAPSAFREWQSRVPPGVEILAAQYPGRERRWKEAPATRMEALVGPLLDALRERPRCPFVVFGHSMGAMVAFELVRGLESAGEPLPEHLFASASAPPGDDGPQIRWEGLDDRAVLTELRALNGIPDEALAVPELLELMLPVIRADLELSSAYRGGARPGPIHVGLTALGGLEDPSVPRESLAGWDRLTSRPGGVRMLRGDHFYLRPSLHDLLGIVLAPLSPHLP